MLAPPSGFSDSVDPKSLLDSELRSVLMRVANAIYCLDMMRLLLCGTIAIDKVKLYEKRS